MLQENALNIYTDGSSYQNPRRGGIGIRFVYQLNATVEATVLDFDLPGYKGATNNEMELQACISSMFLACDFDHIDKFNRILIFTDSMYVVNSYKKALFEWPKYKWLTKSGSPVQNVQLWKNFIKARKKLGNKSLEIKWVKGHAKDINNKVVDKNAKKSANIPLNEPIQFSSVRRKKSDKKTKLGSVIVNGQTILIRIITSAYLKHHKLYKYRYEVFSKDSEFYTNIDTIYFKNFLSTGHYYKVILNNNNKFPMIINVIEEVDKNDI